MKLRIATAGLLALTLTVSAADPFPLDPATLRSLSHDFPYKAPLGDKASFRLPDGLRYVTTDKLQDFVDRMKLAAAGDEVGAVAPPEMSWYVMIYLPKDDPFASVEDPSKLSKEALKELVTPWNEKFTGDHTPRRGGSGRSWKLGNFTHMPVYDAEKKTLSFGNRLEYEGADTMPNMINYKIFAWGPDKKLVCLQLVAPLANYDKTVARTQKLLDDVEFVQPTTEASANETMMYYAKLAGGGLIGAFIVIVLARSMMGKSRGGMVGAAARRPGLPR